MVAACNMFTSNSCSNPFSSVLLCCTAGARDRWLGGIVGVQTTGLVILGQGVGCVGYSMSCVVRLGDKNGQEKVSVINIIGYMSYTCPCLF